MDLTTVTECTLTTWQFYWIIVMLGVIFGVTITK